MQATKNKLHGVEANLVVLDEIGGGDIVRLAPQMSLEAMFAVVEAAGGQFECSRPIWSPVPDAKYRFTVRHKYNNTQVQHHGYGMTATEAAIAALKEAGLWEKYNGNAR